MLSVLPNCNFLGDHVAIIFDGSSVLLRLAFLGNSANGESAAPLDSFGASQIPTSSEFVLDSVFAIGPGRSGLLPTRLFLAADDSGLADLLRPVSCPCSLG